VARRTKELVIQPDEELNNDAYGPEHYLTDEYAQDESDHEQYLTDDYEPEENDEDGWQTLEEVLGEETDEYDEEYADQPAGGDDEYSYDPDDADGYDADAEEDDGEDSADDSGDASDERAEDGTSYGLGEDDYYDLDEIAEIKEKILERKREQAVRERNARLRLLAIILAAVFSVSAFIFSLSGFFTVAYIEVRGNSHFTGEEIRNIAHAVPGHNIIYDPGKKEITEYLEQNPYIKMARVSRKLPSTLVITVEERSENFAFRYDDDYLIMDEDGILLRKSRTEPKLTMVSGMIVNRIKLGEVIGTEKQPVFDKLLELMKEIKEGDLYFVSIDISDMTGGGNNVKANIFDTLVVDTDYDTLLDAVKTGKLHFIVSKLADMGIRRGTIRFNEGGTASYQPAF
jgi:cell division protein FtsQ